MTRPVLHELVDELPAEIIDVAADSLERMRDDPVLRAFLTAPLDDEPLEPEEAALLIRRRAAFLRGGPV